jgi:hypothetical protein
VILATLNGKGQGHYEITNNGTVANPLKGSVGNVIDISAGGAANLAVKVDNNRIDGTGQNVNGVGGIVAGAGTFTMSDSSVLSTPTMTIAITNNNIQNTLSSGIRVNSSDGSPTENVTITGNTVGAPTATTGSLYGIQVLQLSASVDSTINANIASNTAHGGTSSGGIHFPGIGLRKEGASTTVNEFNILNLSPSPATNAQVSTFVSGQNPASDAGDAASFGSGIRAYADINGASGGWKSVASVPAPLLAAHGGVASITNTPGEMHLTQAQLDSVVAAAIAQWASAGASASQLTALHATVFTVADLAGVTVGEQSPGHITIDTDAAGHGWFIDSTPSDSSEFTHALNAAGTDLLTDPSNAAAGHLDLLTAVAHELGHVIGLADSIGIDDANDLMFVNLVDGERRLPDAADVQLANASGAMQAEAALPLSAQAGAGTPIIVGTAANDTIDAGHGGNILIGGAGADNFVFGPNIQLNAPTPAQVTHVADYHAAEGDTFDFSAITSQFHNSGANDALVVRAVEDASGKFATLQVDHIDPMGLPGAPNWVNVAQLDGAHAGDAVNVLIDNHSVHLAQIHVDLLV